MTRYPGERAALAELRSIVCDDVRFADRWAIVEWTRREMHAATQAELLALFDRVQSDIACEATDFNRRAVLARLDHLRQRTRDIVDEQIAARPTIAEDLADALHEMVRVAQPALLTHLTGVGTLAGRIAKDLGLDDDDAQHVMLAGRLCDIGKGVGEAPQQSHPIAGACVLAGITGLSEYAPWVRSHHERLDGSGYPDGLREPDIPFQARIIAVADVFDELVCANAHCSASAVTDAMNHVMAHSGVYYDPLVTASLERVLTSKRLRSTRLYAAA